MNKFIFYFLTILFFLTSCQSFKDGLTGAKRNQSDEFLVEKKNPLTSPPDYDELPVPISDENASLKNKEAGNIKNLLKGKKTNSVTNEQSNNNLEQSIIEKISN